jgi:ATP-binding cassette ChvD family protein
MADTSIITIKSLTKYYGERSIFENINVAFQENCRVCILGKNGAGKSTLMKIISGEDNNFDGHIAKRKGLSFGYLYQEPVLEMEKSVGENITDSLKNFYNLLDRFYEISDLLSDVTNDEEMDKLMEEQNTLQETIDHYDLWDLDRHIDTIMSSLGCPSKNKIAKNLSEGERRRVAFCQLLLQNHDVLMLDEPTNHLDIFSIDWLIKFLRRYRGSVFFVSHSRDFADKLATETLEIVDGSAFDYTGNYSDWLVQKEKRLALEKVRDEKMMKLLAKEKDWVNQGAKARLTKSKARISNYYSLMENFQEKVYNDVEIPLAKPARLGSLVIRVNNLHKAMGKRVLINDLSFSLLPGAIMGIIGPNGAGKSTLLNMLVGLDKNYTGTIEIGSTVRMSYLSQIRKDMDDKKTVWEEITNGLDVIDIGGEAISSRQYCSTFNFRGSEQQKLVGTLSGGERCRVHLAKSLLKVIKFDEDNETMMVDDGFGANLLMLDEPTNDLDLDTVIALESSLMNFPGSGVVVSHDIWFLNKVCTHICIVYGDGTVEIIEGTYESVVTEEKLNKIKAVNELRKKAFEE